MTSRTTTERQKLCLALGRVIFIFQGIRGQISCLPTADGTLGRGRIKTLFKGIKDNTELNTKANELYELFNQIDTLAYKVIQTVQEIFLLLKDKKYDNS